MAVSPDPDPLLSLDTVNLLLRGPVLALAEDSDPLGCS